MQKIKRLLALMLSVVMLVSAVPLPINAQEWQDTMQKSSELTEYAETEAKQTESVRQTEPQTNVDSSEQAQTETQKETIPQTEEQTSLQLEEQESSETDQKQPKETEQSTPKPEEKEEHPVVNIVVRYPEKNPTEDFVYRITYKDQQGTVRNYEGTYFLYNAEGIPLLKEGNNANDGKVTVPLGALPPKGAKTEEAYQLNKEDHTIKGYTIVLDETATGICYTIQEEKAGGFVCVLDSKDEGKPEQKAVAQKDSESPMTKENVRANTARFLYEESTQTEAAESSTETQENTGVQKEEPTKEGQTGEIQEKLTGKRKTVKEVPENPEAPQEPKTCSFSTVYYGSKPEGRDYLVFDFQIEDYNGTYQVTDGNQQELQQLEILNGTGYTVDETQHVMHVRIPVAAMNGSECYTGSVQVTMTMEDAESYTVTVQNKEPLLLTEGVQTISATQDGTFAFSNAKKEYKFTKTWNDGMASHDAAFQTHFVNEHAVIEYKVNGTWTEYPTGDAANSTYFGTPEIAGSVWSYTMKNLPEYDAEGNKMEYRFSEKESCAQPTCPLKKEEYIVSRYTEKGAQDASGTYLMNTQKLNLDEGNSDYQAEILWKDKDVDETGSNSSRPEVEAYVAGLKLYRCAGTGAVEEITVFPDGKTIKDFVEVSSKPESANTWNISLKDLPKYDEKGQEYTYYIKEPADADGKLYATTDYYYNDKYVNTGAYGTMSNALYHGGVVTNTRMENTGFTFCLEWIDGDCTWYRDNTLYLYRYAEGGGGTPETASPVPGFDKMTFEDGVLYAMIDGVKTSIPCEEIQVNGKTYHRYVYQGTSSTAKLDKYSPEGALYTYYIKQKDIGNEDYETTITDSQGNKTDHLFDGGTLVNELKKEDEVLATKIWEAKEVSGALENLEVTMKLQKRYIVKTDENREGTPTEWVDAGQELVLGNQNVGGEDAPADKFSAEICTLSEGFSDTPKYTKSPVTVTIEETQTELPVGTEVEYRVLETNIGYRGSGTHTVTMDDAKGIIKIEGIGQDGTDAVFQRIYDPDNRTVTNRIISETQVKVEKQWTSNGQVTNWPEGATVVVTLHREDGQPVKNLFGEAVDAITLTQNEQTRLFENLPRFDDNGREIVYYVKEDTERSDLQGYGYHSTNYKKVSVDQVDINIDRDTTVKGRIQETDAKIQNVKDGERSYYIRVSKQWLDDGDEIHRQPVQVGIFKKSDIENGTAFTETTVGDKTYLQLNSQKALGTRDLNNGNAWTDRVYFQDTQPNEEINVSDYIALEISVGDNPIRYERDTTPSNATAAIFKAGNEVVNLCGDVTAGFHLYHVYTTTGTTLGESGYIIYNQRYGEVSLELNKTWLNGSKALDGAFFRITRTVSGRETAVPVPEELKGELPTELTNTDQQVVSNDTFEDTLNKENVFYLPYGTSGTAGIELTDQEKYDEYGRMYTYKIEEFAVVDANGKVWWKDGSTVTVFLDDLDGRNPSEMNEAERNAHKYDTYACAMVTNDAATVIKGDGDKHTGDVYAWNASNTRSQQFKVSIRKIWRDDGTKQTKVPVRRPDIYFRMYRVPVNDITTETSDALTAEQILMSKTATEISSFMTEQNRVGNDYVWNTEHNDWYWSCDIDGLFERYDSDGYEYIYFGVENVNGSREEYKTDYYNGLIIPEIKPATDTVDAFDPEDYTANISAPILIIHKEGEGLQAPGTVVNTKENIFKSTSRKIWANLPDNFDKTTLPTLTMELYKKLQNTGNDEPWILSQTREIQGGQTGTPYDDEQQYDAYGRKYTFMTNERYFVEDEAGTYGKDKNGHYTTTAADWVGDKRYSEQDVISGYKSKEMQEGNAFVWTNTYDQKASEKQRVEITLHKTWEYPGYAKGLPTQTFELWRRATGVKDEKVAWNIVDDLTVNATGKTESTVVFTKTEENNSGDYLPYYAPNGTPYEYYVKEIVPGGYDASVMKMAQAQGVQALVEKFLSLFSAREAQPEMTTVSGTKDAGDENQELLVSDVITLEKQGTTENGQEVYKNSNETQKWETDFTNHYTGKPEATPVTAKKTWYDQANAYGTRPDDIVFTLYRTTADSHNTAVDEKVAESTQQGYPGIWSDKKTDTWTYQFENANWESDAYGKNQDKNYFNTYAPDGKKYNYYVVESPAGQDTRIGSYASDAGDGILLSSEASTNEIAVNNMLPTTSVTAKKIWQGTDGTSTWKYEENSEAPHNNQELEKLLQLGAMPEKITFTLQYRDHDSDAWTDVVKNGQVMAQEFELGTIDQIKAIRDTGVTFQDLPKYIEGNNGSAGKNTYRQYQVKETAEYPTNSKESTRFAYKETAAALNGQKNTTVTNEITLKQITLKKIWKDDEDNYLDTRSDTIIFDVKDGEDDTNHAEYTLQHEDGETNFAEWDTQIWIPKNADAYVTEPADKKEPKVSQYYTTGTTVVSDDKTVYTITNTMNTTPVVRTQITAKKSWEDFDNAYASRPAQITYTLQYRYEDEGWQDADEHCNVHQNNDAASKASVTVNKQEDGTYPDVTWSELFQYYKSDTSSGKAHPLTYRVVESANGYATTYFYKGTELGESDGVFAKEADAQEKTGYASFTTAELQVKNTLEKTKIELKKYWGSQTDNDLKNDQTKAMRPKSVTFLVEYSHDGGTNWEPLPTMNAYGITDGKITLTTGDVTKWQQSMEIGCDAEHNPQLPLEDGAGNQYLYRVSEVSAEYDMGGTTKTVAAYHGGNEQAAWADLGGGTTSTLGANESLGAYQAAGTTTWHPATADTAAYWSAELTNTLQTVDLKTTKTWTDDANRDGYRSNITFSVTPQIKQESNWTTSSDFSITAGELAWNANPLEVTWENLPKYRKDAEGLTEANLYRYKVTEQLAANSDKYTTQSVPEVDPTIAATELTVAAENTHNIETMTIKAGKEWLDYANAMYGRPGKVEYTLQYTTDLTADIRAIDAQIWKPVSSQKTTDGKTPYVKDGEAVTQEITALNWAEKAQWTVPQNWYDTTTGESKALRYRVLETTVAGYTRVAWASFTKNETTLEETIQNQVDTTTLKFTKTWAHEGIYASAVRPASVTYRIEYNKEDGGTNDWKELPNGIDANVTEGLFTLNTSSTATSETLTLSGLPLKASDGKQFVYRVSEVSLNYSDTNKVAVDSANRIWTVENQNKTSSSTGATAGTYQVTETTKWKAGTNSSQWEANITNTMEWVDHQAKKTWMDDFDRDGYRGNVEFTLKRDGTSLDASKQTVTVDKTTLANNTTEQTVLWQQLPKYKNDAATWDDTTLSEYTTVENYIAGSQTAVQYAQSRTEENNANAITNTHQREKTVITATKTWNDYDNAFGSRPQSIYFKLQYAAKEQPTESDWKDVLDKNPNDGVGAYLLKTGETVKQQLTASNAVWSSASWTVPTNWFDTGSKTSKAMKYRVVECDASGTVCSINGYTKTDSILATAEKDSTKTSNVTNTLQTTELAFTKKWNNDTTYLSQVRPNAVTYVMEYKVGNDAWKPVPLSKLTATAVSPNKVTLGTDATGEFTVTVDPNKNQDAVTFAGLPKKNSSNETYLYRVYEKSLKYGETVVPAQRTTVQITTNGNNSASTNATAGSYTVAEQTTQQTDASWKSEITNTLETTTYKAKKSWVDEANRDGYRQQVPFVLKRDNEDFDTNKQAGTGVETSTVKNETTVIWEGLPKYKNTAQNQTDIDSLSTYLAVESNPYTNGTYTNSAQVPAETEGTITNTHNIETLQITALKNWQDYDNAMDSRPTTISFTLQYATAENAKADDAVNSANWKNVYSVKTETGYREGVDAYAIQGNVTQSITDWSLPASWNVPANWFDVTANPQTSKPLKYRILETDVTGYTRQGFALITKDSTEKQETIKNTLDKTTLSFTKNWANEDVYASAVRPDSVVYQIEYNRIDGEESSWKLLPDSVQTKKDKDDTTVEVTDGMFTLPVNKNGVSDTIRLEGLPLQDSNGKKYIYRVSEVKLLYGTIEVPVLTDTVSWTRTENTTDSTWANAIAGPYDTGGATTWNTQDEKWTAQITNRMVQKTHSATKTWTDDYNRDGYRGSILFTLNRDNASLAASQKTVSMTDLANTEVTKTVTWDTLPKYQNTYGTDGKRQESVYTTTESYVADDANNLVQSKYPDPTGNGTNAITNTHQIEQITITASKNWSDYGNAMSTRPEEIYFTLQYTTEATPQESDWTNVTATAQTTDGKTPYLIGDKKLTTQQLKAPTGDGADSENWGNVSWTVPANWFDASEGVNTSKSLKYRVVETNAAGVIGNITGYQVSESNILTIDTANRADTSTIETTLTNTLNVTRLTIHKSWEDEGTYQTAMRPDQITYLLEYSLTGTANDWHSVPTSYDARLTDGKLTLDIKEETSEETSYGGTVFEHLPIENSRGTKFLYRISETAIAYNGTSVAANLNQKGSAAWTYVTANQKSSFVNEGTTSSVGAYTITKGETYWTEGTESTAGGWTADLVNTLETVSLEAAKNWEDDGNRDNIRRNLTFSVVMKEPDGNNLKATGIEVASKDLVDLTKEPNMADANGNLKPEAPTTVTWEGLPKYNKWATDHTASSNLYRYEISETEKAQTSVPTGYKATYEQADAENPENGVLKAGICNTHDICSFKIEGQKEWQDQILQGKSDDTIENPKKPDSWQYTRPEKVTLSLQYDNGSKWVAIPQVEKVVSELPENQVAQIIYLKKAENAANTQADGYYRWDADSSAYVPEPNGIYTTSTVNQTIDGTKGTTDQWTGAAWENLPTYYLDRDGNRQVAQYRVVESAVTDAAGTEDHTYLFAKPSDPITGLNDQQQVSIQTATVTNKLLSLKLHKVDGEGRSLENVEFELQNANNEIVVASAVTNSNGIVTFVGLKPGTYYVKEKSTAQGQQLLAAPFEVQIPLTMTQTEIDAKNQEETEKVNLTNAVQKADKSGWEFYQLTHTVTNTANFAVPLTGSDGIWYPGLLAFLPVTAAYMLYRRKKKCKRA